MSRRDTILVAVLINAGLLALLFMIAINPEEEKMFGQFDHTTLVSSTPTIEEKVELEPVITFTKSAVEDEIDNALQNYAEKIAVDTPKKAEVQKANDQPLTITVKRGDMLERIARANGTTVKKIKQLNQLKDERLEIGQVLQVPPMQQTEIAQETKKKADVEQKEEFYTIKSGDNPWKIAKQFNVRFDELLNLNHLDEEKARRLRAGDKIRVH